MRELTITDLEAGQRLNKYLMKYLNQAPSSFLYKMLRKKNITRNGAKASGDEILVRGDIIRLFLADETIDKFRITKDSTEQDASQRTKAAAANLSSLQILYQTKDILAVHKPVGVLSQKAKKDDYSINEAILDYCKATKQLTSEQLETFHPSISNRLDRNTSGIILAGISLKGSQMLAENLKKHQCKKYYYTIVQGVLKQPIHDTAYIVKHHATNVSKIQKAPGEHASKIETAFTPLAWNNGFTLLQVQLFTGKSHQIRAHLKYLGFPMVGDTKYGNQTVNQKLQQRYHLKNHLLHAGKICLPGHAEIVDPLPDKFRTVADGLGLPIPDTL